MPSPGNIEEVYAGFFQLFRKDLHILPGGPPFYIILATQTHTDWIIRAHLTAYLGDDLQAKTHPIRQGTSIFILAQIGKRRQKLIDDISR